MPLWTGIYTLLYFFMNYSYELWPITLTAIRFAILSLSFFGAPRYWNVPRLLNYWNHIRSPTHGSSASVHCLCIYHQSWLKYYVQDAMVPNVRKPKFCSLALQHCTLIWKHVCSLRVQFVVALLNLYKGTWVWAFSLFCGHIQRKKITVSKVAGILHITSPVNITSRKKIGKYFQMLMYNEKNQVFTKLIQVAS